MKTTTYNTDWAAEKTKIRSFFDEYYVDNEDGSGKAFPYRDQVFEIARRDKQAIVVNVDHIKESDIPDALELSEAITSNTKRYEVLFKDTISDMIQDYLGDKQAPVIDALDAYMFQRLHMDRNEGAANEEVSLQDKRKKYPPQLLQRFEVYFTTDDAAHETCVRNIKATEIGHLVSMKGVVIRATEVKPCVEVMTYTCDTCAAEVYQPVKGMQFTPPVNCPNKECVEAKANGRLHMQLRGSKFVKFQELKIQELSEQVPVGSIPRTMTVHVYGEMTRKCNTGNVVHVSGVFLPIMQSGFRPTGGLVADTYLEAHYINNLDDNPTFNGVQSAELEVLRRKGDNYETLAASIAPEIFGHVDVKKCLLMALVGGNDNSSNGMKIRGCINVLMMGDPGVAKSQLLGYVNRLAPRSQYTTGRGSSGVGLTAAVMKDPVTGEMSLEGGALVLADGGICCIDEFDKMMDHDRTAIHEVMEQQTISIAKAGIMTTLNARTAIIAAANPAYGRYNPNRSIEQNVDLPAALLSRFDLILLMQDKADRENDKILAEHITYVHQHGCHPNREKKDLISLETLREYISLCKTYTPTVDPALRERIVEAYVEMRRDARYSSDPTFVSPRMILGIVRMATARAKLRLSTIVDESDVEEALRLMQFAKDSLRPEQNKIEKRMAPVDAAFAVLRELYHADNAPIAISNAIQRCARKGISEVALKKCLDQYTANGLLVMDRQNIVFAMN
ncbi:DNA replication licensing factor MCM7 [Caenorhabditis elegans]|uniref:DNA replication licensing factor MCM7 n=1 Tax=Caenorhabditis elegans TaxID=6239 RepID=O16297_CAEEL|nr:DNA replication licensing factor MCM7 [Caenorhabditis elegans]8OUW_7 Chain 7, DNA replication licensing factor MCM7 [Caenorhabditis elegans]CCD68490.1 DNA replication licensing factor MCM7 [Caenorhabditis elegans]|eukprot:NP_504199.1 DNA replication licensing factor MCM7 [Caenorhabditis elegans]